jgi:hypothetical protein
MYRSAAGRITPFALVVPINFLKVAETGLMGFVERDVIW